MTDKEKIIKYLDEIDSRLGWIVDEYKVSEDIYEFLLSLSTGEIETMREAREKANELWRQL